MKVLSWNVAGIRAVLKKGTLEFVLKGEYDVLCFQETKAEEQQVKNVEKYKELYPYQIWNSSKTKKGYSGTAIWSKIPFVSTLPTIDFDNEGRVVAVEYEEMYLVTVYTPNSKGDLSRLEERTKKWDTQFREYCNNLKEVKPVVICGDLNVIHQEIDINCPEKHLGNKYAGYTMEERAEFTKLLSCGYFDAFRKFNKSAGNYTWWSYISNARQNNVGWRLDYFVVDDLLNMNCTNSTIERDIMGSDHCPITLTLNFTNPIHINKEPMRRRSMSYPTPPDLKESKIIESIKRPKM